MLAYIMITDGEMEVIPVDVNIKTFTHITIHNRRLSRTLLMQSLHYYSINDIDTPVFLLPQAAIDNTDQK